MEYWGKKVTGWKDRSGMISWVDVMSRWCSKCTSCSKNYRISARLVRIISWLFKSNNRRLIVLMGRIGRLDRTIQTIKSRVRHNISWLISSLNNSSSLLRNSSSRFSSRSRSISSNCNRSNSNISSRSSNIRSRLNSRSR